MWTTDDAVIWYQSCMIHAPAPFAPPVNPPTPLRTAITAAYRRPERDCVRAMLPAAQTAAPLAGQIRDTATTLVTALRATRRGSGVEALVQEYALSSDEGVALMCLAEALLRIPDEATRDALIRDKIAPGNWRAHLGASPSLFVNAATWGLIVTGKLVDTSDDRGLGAALSRVISRVGEPVIRRGVDLAMRMMGEQFVTGETIERALDRARAMEAQGFRYSYDMLGEAAMTARDADRFGADYRRAIDAIGIAAAGKGVYAGPGISVKLSALHPRYSRAQAERVMAELLPRLKGLALQARGYDIGFNIDAEESDRLELSLDLLQALARDPDLAGWDGLGFVVQAYGKRCPFVIDWLIDLAATSGRRIMVRLVKGAYWDAEIKRAQVDGMADFPVFTRKVHTDAAYLACARKLLDGRRHVFPQFATHNAQTVASIYHFAGPDFAQGDYEFQCLHGMGEPLYAQVVGAGRLDRPCRVYAPVGTHETLLPYLVRRLLENGANSSFVNRIADPDVPIAELVADPAAEIAAMDDPGAPHLGIDLPRDLYRDRRNSSGIDLSDEAQLAALSAMFADQASLHKIAEPDGVASGERVSESVRNPADRAEVVGTAIHANPADVQAAVARAAAAAPEWAARAVHERARMLENAADAMQQAMPELIALTVREAGKSAANGIAEVREAIDFLRYYAGRAAATLDHATPLGPVACISPWNFPLAIFTGQVSAALVAGNTVLAKPAEETPLIAAEAVRILHGAGIPEAVLQLVPGAGDIGAALVGNPGIQGVIFTGSTAVARAIQGQLATRLSPSGLPIPLIAETGGQNAMVVDSSALTEQVVGDVLASAFDSAGQRCSALRILCLQDDIADQTLAMLHGALNEVRVGNTHRLAVDVGPVITAEARDRIEEHVTAMAARGHRVTRLPLPDEAAAGTFVAPTIIEIGAVSDVQQEVFGPVLHVLRWRAGTLDTLLSQINATGYGLTFGLHTRLDETIDRVTRQVEAGNLYINRNVIGAVVGVQPFGGRGLSGTGPKAGGPLYLNRLVQGPLARPVPLAAPHADPAATDLADWLDRAGHAVSAQLARTLAAQSPLGTQTELPGPVGERNIYAVQSRGTVWLRPVTEAGLFHMLAAALATGNHVLVEADPAIAASLAALPETVRARLAANAESVSVAVAEGDDAAILAAQADFAGRDGALITLHRLPTGSTDADALCLDWLIEEVSTAINTTAAGGNASLMAVA